MCVYALVLYQKPNPKPSYRGKSKIAATLSLVMPHAKRMMDVKPVSIASHPGILVQMWALGIGHWTLGTGQEGTVVD